LDVRSITASGKEPAIATIVLGFAADPVNAEVRPCIWRSAFGEGGAFCTNECSGVALWLPPGIHPDVDQMGQLMEGTTSPAARADGPSIFEQMAKHHPSEPHWYLPLIGVDPANQGKGHGDALISYALERCDRDKALAYLESTTPRNISLYRRHGFEALGTIQVGSAPPIVPMLRRAR
jgi:GNAT superfamily N-acetyltransferase